MPEISFITCARLPDLDPDDQLALEHLSQLGVTVVPAVWDDPNVDWDRFDLSVIRSTWDYTDRRDLFVAWAGRVPRLLNNAAIVGWNTDKRYLADLAAVGLPVVQTTWIAPSDSVTLPDKGEYVLKPSVGAGSMDAGRYDLGDAAARRAGTQHVATLLGNGQTVMLQPYAHAIEEAGETAVVMLNGEFSHAIRKGPMLGSANLNDVDGLYKEERIEAKTASAAELALGRAAIEARPVTERTSGEPPLYARVDMVPDEHGRPVLMELELTEPSLFMVTQPETAKSFAAAIAKRIARQT